jgi:TonB family protein
MNERAIRTKPSVQYLLILVLTPVMAFSQNPPSAQATPQASQPAATGQATVDPSHSFEPLHSQLTLAKSVPIVYPMAAQQAKTQGYVTLKITISQDGDVESVDTVSGDPALAAAATDSVKQWRFQPFTKDGRPVKVSTDLSVRFGIGDGKCSTTAGQTIVSTSFDHRVTVTPSEMQGLLCKKVTPIRTGLSAQANVRGDVAMAVNIGKDGTVQSVSIIRSASPILNPPAIEAVRRSRYRPYLVSGEPVEVDTIVTVSFF